LIDLGVGCEVIEKSGAWLNYGNIRLGQGRESSKKYLEENKEVADGLKNKILVAKGLIAEGEK